MSKYLTSVLDNVKALKNLRAHTKHDIFSNLEVTQEQLNAALEIINAQAVVIAAWLKHNELESLEKSALMKNSIDILTLDVYNVLGTS